MMNYKSYLDGLLITMEMSPERPNKIGYQEYLITEKGEIWANPPINKS